MTQKLEEIVFKEHLKENAKRNWFEVGKVYTRGDIEICDGKKRKDLAVKIREFDDFNGKIKVKFLAKQGLGGLLFLSHVYFTLPDESEWKGDKNWKDAFEKVCKWSNEVYRQKFILDWVISIPRSVEVENNGQASKSSVKRLINNLSNLNIYPDSGKFLKDSIKKYKEKIKTQQIVQPKKICKNSFEDTETANVKGQFIIANKGQTTSIPYATLSHSPIRDGKVEAKVEFSKGNVRSRRDFKEEEYKSLKKVQTACNLLDINHFWMNELCIRKFDKEEIKQEMQKMGKYYSNSAVTLIAIHENLGKTIDPQQIIQRIVNSRWFSRVWTYQEGLLSQRTLFMFDDCLVDGTWLAQYWVEFNQVEIDKGNKKMATPLGWVYYKGGYSSKDNLKAVFLDKKFLNEIVGVLDVVTKQRQVTIAKDIIYSILGLFPLGKDVEYEYKPYLCGGCGGKQSDYCEHDEKYKDHDPYYSLKELNEGLEEFWEALRKKNIQNESMEKLMKIFFNKSVFSGVDIKEWWNKTKDKHKIARQKKISELKDKYQKEQLNQQFAQVEIYNK